MKGLSALLLGAMGAMMTTTAMAQNWDNFVDRYFNEAVYPFSPSTATSAGFHSWDSNLEDYSAATIHRQAETLRKFEKEALAFPANQMDRDLHPVQHPFPCFWNSIPFECGRRIRISIRARRAMLLSS